MSAPDSPIWVLLGQLVTVLEDITTANGYRTELGDNVVRELSEGLAADPDANPPPRIVVGVVGKIGLDIATTQRRVRTFQVTCEATVWGDETNGQQQALAALEDMMEALPRRTQITQATGISSDVKIAGAEIANRPEGLPVTAAAVLLDVTMTEARSP